MNRKAEGIMNLIAIQMAKLRGDLDGLGGLGKSLEALTFDDYTLLGLDDWGLCKEVAERIEGQHILARRALGFSPPFVPGDISKSKAFAGITPRQEDGKAAASAGGKLSAARRAARPPGTRKGAVSGYGRASADAALPRHAKGKQP